MDKQRIGITSANGWPWLSFGERFAAYQRAGFRALMLWWGEDEKEARGERVALAKAHNLHIENVHADMTGSNALWEPGAAGDRKMREHMDAVEDCDRHGIRRMVIHLTNGNTPPDISGVGLERIERLIEWAVKHDVTLAMENVRTDEHIKYVLDHYKDKHVGFCYDAGHANIWRKETDWLALYAHRLSAVHLHGNNGKEDRHLLPFTGTIDWAGIMGKISESAYDGCLTLETEYTGGEDGSRLEDFLNASYQSGRELALL